MPIKKLINGDLQSIDDWLLYGEFVRCVELFDLLRLFLGAEVVLDVDFGVLVGVGVDLFLHHLYVVLLAVLWLC